MAKLIGTGPNQVPTNGDLGSMAFEDIKNYKNLIYTSVKDFAVVGDGVADDTANIQKALDSGKKVIFFPEGTYKISDTLTVPKGVSIKGAGKEKTIFDATAMDYSTISDNKIIKTSPATFTAIASLNSNISLHDRTFTLASAPSLVQGDIVLIHNPTNSSWSSWRTYYNAGEYVKVAFVNGATITIDGSFVDNYATGDVNIYKVDMESCEMSGFTIDCNPDDDGQSIRGLFIDTGTEVIVRDVEVHKAPYTGITISRCYSFTVENCLGTDNYEDEFGGEYGLTIGNSQNGRVANNYFVSNRHGITTGGGSDVGNVSCRFINFTNNIVKTVGGSQAFDLHGNAEYINIDGNTIDGGAVLSGDYVSFTNNVVYGDANNGSQIMISELKGTHFNISSNTIRSNMQDANRGQFIDSGGNGDNISNAERGGTFKIINNNLIYDKVDINNSEWTAIRFNNRGYSGNEKISLMVSGNTCRVSDEYADLDEHIITDFIHVRYYSGDVFETVLITNNDVKGGYAIFSSGGTGTFITEKAIITGNTFINGYQGTATASKLIKCSNNTFIGCEYYPYYLVTTTTDGTVHLTNNLAKDCFWNRTSSSTTNVIYGVTNTKNAFVSDNFADDNNLQLRLTATPSGFTTGETITGGTSGATATYYAQRDTDIFIKDTLSGTFVSGETITGGTSGATGTVSASVAFAVRSYYGRFHTITNLWSGSNIDTVGKGNYKTGVTNDNAL